MGKAKFIDKVKEVFGFQSEAQKKELAIKELIEKLEQRKLILKQELRLAADAQSRENLKDSIKIVKQQIKKGKSLLQE
ncbi:MAG TPA: hypothetical protein CFH82_07585 [Sulfurospirillum sp. UBA12182]|jgi:hypothetical protein|nr:MAG TPA: hypothetical protein CFH82_07585 [Sulfurospirillum sp. UBA12182]